jgi:hypothetical protein
MNSPVAPRFTFLCTHCGSSAIARDAWAEWDPLTQAWVLGALFDYAHCHACGAESPPREVMEPGLSPHDAPPPQEGATPALPR